MIKFGDVRINPNHVKKYFPHEIGYVAGEDLEYQIGFHFIDGSDYTVKFNTEEERDKMLDAVDELLLILNDGEKVLPPQLMDYLKAI